MSRRRVVVTGLGLISPVGNTVGEGWANLIAGRSGIANITRFDASAFACKFAGEVKGFQIEDYIPAKEARHMDTFIHFGLAASMQAVRDAGLATNDALTEEQAERLGVSGWIRNCPDGSVEAHIEGEEGSVNWLIDLIGDGPPSARVANVRVSDAAVEELSSFEVRR